jgi:hypothetical protein
MMHAVLVRFEKAETRGSSKVAYSYDSEAWVDAVVSAPTYSSCLHSDGKPAGEAIKDSAFADELLLKTVS